MNVSLVDLIDTFDNDDACRDYLEQLRWPNGPVCPRCESTSVSRIAARRQYDCNSCRYQFSVTAGTLFHDSHLPLRKWFLAIYLICESRKGISAKQLERMLKVTYRTAWYLSHRIREAMGEDEQPLLNGIIEVDETYIGGKRRHVGRGYIGNKAVVVGAVERDGEVRLKVVPSKDRATLEAFIAQHTHPDSMIFTDDAPVYDYLAESRHREVNHSAEEWVRGDVHTNTVEGVWSLFKRSVVGSYHKVSIKHLPAYLDEMEFRFNGRDNPFLFRDTLVMLLEGEAMTYKALTA
ncbi:MAG: IS1595 family transposase [Solirubrobacteraceae bacterium]